MKTAAARYRITLVSTPSDVPALVRLRKALKCLLRSYRLRAERVEEIQASAIEPPRAG